MSEETHLLLRTPPLPYYLGAGRSDYRAGEAHPNRRRLGLYDLLLVEQGTLHIGENGREWALSAGEMLLLLPEGEHYATKPCEDRTAFYWVHFDHGGAADGGGGNAHGMSDAPATDLAGWPAASPNRRPFDNPYAIRMPKHARLPDPAAAVGLVKAMLSPQAENAFWEEQRLFAELLALLSAGRKEEAELSSRRLAEQAVTYLQRHFREDLTNGELAQALHFHPNYVVRCVKAAYGLTPMEYLQQYRMERAKRLLITTAWPIARIAEETGFRYAPYFSACFKLSVGLSPLRYRKQYWT